MGIRVLVRGAVLAAVAAGSFVTVQAASASEACAAEIQACTPYKKQEEGFSSKRSCDWAGSSGAQAGRWTGWNCNQALGGWELWVRTCTARSAEQAAIVRD